MLFGTVVTYPTINHKLMPNDYKLGKGHIMFFKNKLQYLGDRLTHLKIELDDRGYQTQNVEDVLSFYKDKVPDSFKNNWMPRWYNFKPIVNRLLLRHGSKPTWYTYHGKNISSEDYQLLLSDLRK